MAERKLRDSELWALVVREVGWAHAVRLLGWCVAWGLSGHRSLTRVVGDAGMDRSVVTVTLSDLKQVLAAYEGAAGGDPAHYNRMQLREFAGTLAALGRPGARPRRSVPSPASRAS